jgi:amino acid transporter, AAT family
MQNAIEEAKSFNYLYGLVNFLVVFGIVWLMWYIFMNPNGIMQLYTPMYGFALLVVMLSTIVLMTNVADYYPFSKPAPEDNFLVRGILLIGVAFILMLFIHYGFFWNFLGRLGIAYFSPNSIIASGGIGAEPFVARENASTAILYFFTAFLWVALFWNLGFGRWPWINVNRGTLAFSRLFTILFFASIIYAILFHPHVCSLFYPAQDKAGVAPWWENLTQTGSAFFGLGLALCSLFWITASQLLWEGYPWKLMDRNGEGHFWKGIVVFAGTLALGAATLWILLQIFVVFWNEPFMGGQYTDGPDFRLIHAGEISGFFLLSAFILKTYFNNFPNLKSIWTRSIVRTLLSIAMGFLFYLFYYSPLATFFLAKVPGVAQPGDTPLVFTMLFLCVILIQRDFFYGWSLQQRDYIWLTEKKETYLEVAS